jgi:hypothetical protein
VTVAIAGTSCDVPQAILIIWEPWENAHLFLNGALRHMGILMEKDAKTPPKAGTETFPKEAPVTDLATAARKSAGKAVWMGTAAGIGSAAIVAALLYAKKRG